MKITRALITSVLLGSLLVAAPVASFAAPGDPHGGAPAPRIENGAARSQPAPAAPRPEPEPPRHRKKSSGAAVGGALLHGLAVGTAIGSSSN